MRAASVVRRPSASAPARRPRLLGELLVVGVLVFAYDRIRNLARARRDVSLHDAADLLHLERLLHVDVELRFNTWLSAHRLLAEVASWYYQLAHLTVTLLVLAWCYWRHPSRYRPARNALVLINVLGLAIFWGFPVAPPRLLPGAGFVDTTLVTGVARAMDSSADPYAAMPSLHIGWATWVAIVGILCMARSRWRFAWVAYPVATTLVVVGTGNHYLSDVAAGAAVALACALLTGLIPRRRPAIDPGPDDVGAPDPVHACAPSGPS